MLQWLNRNSVTCWPNRMCVLTVWSPAAPVVFCTRQENNVIWSLVYWWVERRQCCSAERFSQHHTKPLTLNCAALWSTHCLLQHHEMVSSGQNGYSAVSLAPFFLSPSRCLLPHPTNTVTHWNWLEEHMALPPRATEMLALISSVWKRQGIVRN